MNTPDHLLYTKDHEWANFKDNEVVIGITDYAQSQLGDVIFIEFPDVVITIRMSFLLPSEDKFLANNSLKPRSFAQAVIVATPMSRGIIGIDFLLFFGLSLTNSSVAI